MSRQATYALTAAQPQAMSNHLGRVAQSPKAADIPRDRRHGNLLTVQTLNRKVTEQKFQAVTLQRLPIHASSLPCGRHETRRTITEYVRKLTLSELNARACFVTGESAELVGTAREVRNQSAPGFPLMRPTMKKPFSKLVLYPFGKMSFRVESDSVPVGYDRRRERSSDQWFQSDNDFLDFMRVNRAHVVNDDNERSSCHACSGAFDSTDVAHSESEPASPPLVTWHGKVSITTEAIGVQRLAAIVGKFTERGHSIMKSNGAILLISDDPSGVRWPAKGRR
jgi:hypothetical protein